MPIHIAEMSSQMLGQETPLAMFREEAGSGEKNASPILVCQWKYLVKF